LKQIAPFLTVPDGTRSRAAIFLSGSGTNAEKILKEWQRNARKQYDVVVLFTDKPQRSRARFLAEKYELPLVENDIREFYHQRGCNRVSLATEQGKQLREEWTDCIRRQLQDYTIDFALFAGFIPLTNITADFPCLNIHPGDLTYKKDGSRYLIGLHTIPIEKAILEGLGYLRSSVILASPYFVDESNMDSGPILGISKKVKVDLFGFSLSQLKSVAESRPSTRPVKGFNDDLEHVASQNQENLKRRGDWDVFPRVVAEFAENKYGTDDTGRLYYRPESEWISIKTVIFGNHEKKAVACE
jgi:folate-dependent phosphoribosylglycinamide formyltransferase PurN